MCACHHCDAIFICVTMIHTSKIYPMNNKKSNKLLLICYRTCIGILVTIIISNAYISFESIYYTINLDIILSSIYNTINLNIVLSSIKLFFFKKILILIEIEKEGLVDVA